MGLRALSNFTSIRNDREDHFVEDLTDYELNKEHRTFGLKVFKNLLDSLNKTKRAEASFALLVETEGDYVEMSYFKNEKDALYSKRKLRKISRLAFHDEFRLSIVAIKDIE